MRRECGTEADKDAFETTRQEIAANLRMVLERLKTQYDTEVPDVYITGYYHLVSAEDTPLSSHSNISEYLNRNGSPVPKKFLFPGDEFEHIDGVIFSEISKVQEMLGKHSAYEDSAAKLHLFPNFSSQQSLPNILREAMYYHDISLSDDMISISGLEQGRDSSKHGVWL